MNTTFPFSDSGKRVRCPSCDARQGFAPTKEDHKFGHCFACDYKNYPAASGSIGKQYKSETLQLRTQNILPNEQEVCPFVDEKKISDSMSYLHKIPLDPNRDCTPEEERAAIMEYEGGLDCSEAERVSRCNERSATDEELSDLYRRSPFAATLVELTRASILIDWNIGFASDGSTLFWYQNINRRFVNAKRIRYSDDGFHRDKKSVPSYLYRSSDGFGLCIYGEQQLHPQFENYLGRRFQKAALIVLVESEKTAIIMSHHKPEMIWLASGGALALTKSKASVLKGRKVFILYDRDPSGETGAKKVEKVLRNAHAIPMVINQFELFKGKSHGFDIADSIFEEFNRKGITL